MMSRFSCSQAAPPVAMFHAPSRPPTTLLTWCMMFASPLNSRIKSMRGPRTVRQFVGESPKLELQLLPFGRVVQARQDGDACQEGDGPLQERRRSRPRRMLPLGPYLPCRRRYCRCLPRRGLEAASSGLRSPLLDRRFRSRRFLIASLTAATLASAMSFHSPTV